MRITLPIPPSANSYWRIFRNRILLSAEARKYKAVAALIGKRILHEPLDGNVAVFLHVYRARRIGDLDNFLKATLDACRGVLFEDDKQVTEIHAYRNDDPKRPRVDVVVENVARGNIPEPYECPACGYPK